MAVPKVVSVDPRKEADRPHERAGGAYHHDGPSFPDLLLNELCHKAVLVVVQGPVEEGEVEDVWPEPS